MYLFARIARWLASREAVSEEFWVEHVRADQPPYTFTTMEPCTCGQGKPHYSITF